MTQNGLTKNEPKFPTAHAPGATNLSEVFEVWEQMGLEPVEVAAEDLAQHITIKHNALTGKIEWTTRKMDGIQALGIMASAMMSMFEYFIKAQPRPTFSSGQAAVAIKLDDTKLTVGLNPKQDPTVIKGITAAALWEIISRAGGGPGDWLDLFIIDTEQNNGMDNASDANHRDAHNGDPLE